MLICIYDRTVTPSTRMTASKIQSQKQAIGLLSCKTGMLHPRFPFGKTPVSCNNLLFNPCGRVV